MVKLTIFFLLSVSLIFAAPSSKGIISGSVVDAQNGEPIVGANIYLESTPLGAASDLDGKFLIENVPPGSYTLVISVIGYSEMHITGLKVKADEIRKLNLAVKPEILTTEVVEVEAKALRNTEAALLKDRQKSAAVSDAISAEAISQAGSGNVAEALKQITGVSVVDGKYIYVRGLGDRYTSTQLNGAEMPGTNPYRKTASIDLIPTDLVENIVTVKSFTPDEPGDFSGGLVNINTKDFPDRLLLSTSISTAFNTQTTFNNNGALGFSIGNLEWLGMNDGTLDLPSIVKDKNVEIPTIAQASKDESLAKQLVDITRAFNKEIAPSSLKPPLNQSFSLSMGNQIQVFNRPLGYLMSFSYHRSFSGYDNGIFRRWNQGSKDVMANVFDLTEKKTTQEVLWGGLVKLSYKLRPDHVLSFNGIFNKSGELTARYLQGSYPYDMDANRIFRASVLNFSERTLLNGQIKGEHFLPFLYRSRVEWMASTSKTLEDQPDQRYFNSFYDPKNGYGIKDNTPPSRYFSKLEESKTQLSINLKTPFSQWSGLKGYIKMGGFYLDKRRDYSERLFKMVDQQGFDYNGDPNSILANDNIGIVDTIETEIRGVKYRSLDWGVVVQETKLPANNYFADQKISSSYLMFELPIFSSLRFIGGVRYESTDMGLGSQDTTIERAVIKTRDFLPSLNFVYSVVRNMNLRFSLSRTLARPTFREIGPFATFDFMGGDVYIGNQFLQRTLIENVDLRWEWFSRPGEIYAVSTFYKKFKNPIERVFNTFGENTWKNVNYATAYGMEFEVRKRLDVIYRRLNNFMFGSNLALIKSNVQIDKEELDLIWDLRSNASPTRPFQGQSSYLINLNLTYNNPGLGLSSTVYYNIFGKRLDKVSYAGTPDVYEAPAGVLNFTLEYQVMQHFALKVGVKNLLNPYLKKYQEFQGKKYIYSQYKRGRTISVGLNYKL